MKFIEIEILKKHIDGIKEIKDKYHDLINGIEKNITKRMEKEFIPSASNNERQYYSAHAKNFMRFEYDKNYIIFVFMGYVVYDDRDYNSWETTYIIKFGISFNVLINSHNFILKSLENENNDYDFFYKYEEY